VSHPSRLALDRLALGLEDGAVGAHATQCPECSAHLQRVQVELPVPAWVGEVRARRLPFPRWALGLAAAGAALLVLLWGTQPSEPPAITAKGAPEAKVWLKRGETVAPWGGGAVRANDAFRVEVAPGDFTQLTLVDRSGGRLQVVHRGAVAGHSLSPTFVFDEEPGPEEVTVLLSREPLSEEAAKAAVDGGTGVWTRTWSFSKETR